MVICLDIILGYLLYLLSSIYMVPIYPLSQDCILNNSNNSISNFQCSLFYTTNHDSLSTTSIQIHDYDNFLVAELWEVAQHKFFS